MNGWEKDPYDDTKVRKLVDRSMIHDNLLKLDPDKAGESGSKIFIYRDGKRSQVVHNKTVIAGSQFTAQKVWGIDERAVEFPSYNKSLKLPNSVTQLVPDNTNKICLFCIGTDGCGKEKSQVYPVKYASKIPDEYLVPFRYEDMDEDIPYAQRSIYYGRTLDTKKGKIPYYFKALDTDPQMFIEYTDGTSVLEDIYNVTDTQRVVCYVETRLRITKSDCRDWFLNSDVGLEGGILSSLSLCTAWYKTSAADGFKYYQDIHPYSILHFAGEPIIDLTKGLVFIYRMYF